MNYSIIYYRYHVSYKSNFETSPSMNFKVSYFQDSNNSKFQRFEVSRFQYFKYHKIPRFLNFKFQMYKMHGAHNSNKQTSEFQISKNAKHENGVLFSWISKVCTHIIYTYTQPNHGTTVASFQTFFGSRNSCLPCVGKMLGHLILQVACRSISKPFGAL